MGLTRAVLRDWIAAGGDGDLVALGVEAYAAFQDGFGIGRRAAPGQ